MKGERGRGGKKKKTNWTGKTAHLDSVLCHAQDRNLNLALHILEEALMLGCFSFYLFL